MVDKLALEDKEKSLYLTQIRYLDEQLERCQLKCDELEKQNKDFVSLYSALEKEKTDITEYLKHSAAEKEKKVEELVVQLEKQQQEAEQDREALILQHIKQRVELQKQIDQLNLVKIRQVAKLEEQEEQKEQLMELMQQLPDKESLDKQLVHQREEHEAAVDSLKSETVLERAKMFEKKNTMDDCINTKISKILQEERAQHSEQLEKVQMLLKENMNLWEQKDNLQDSEREFCSAIEELREEINRFNKEVFINVKEVDRLKKQCERKMKALKDCCMTHEYMLAREEVLRSLVASVAEKCCQKTAEAHQMSTELQKESSRRRQLEADIQEAAIILRHILMDSGKLSEGKMQRLLEILKSTMPQGPDSDPQGTGHGLSDSTEPVPKPDRAETQNFATDPLFLMARYRPGDLGLVPRPTWKHKPADTSTQLPLNSCVDQSAPAPHQDDSDGGTLASAEPAPVISEKDECSLSPTTSE